MVQASQNPGEAVGRNSPGGAGCWGMSQQVACKGLLALSRYAWGMGQAGRTLGLEVDHDNVYVPYGYYCVCRNRALSAR